MSVPTLKPRERDILELSAAGLTQVEIAAELGMSMKTVGDWSWKLRQALAAKTMPHAVAIAYQRGLLGGAR